MLKLYFRGLENPLFPKDRFNDLISCVRKSLSRCLLLHPTPGTLPATHVANRYVLLLNLVIVRLISSTLEAIIPDNVYMWKITVGASPEDNQLKYQTGCWFLFFFSLAAAAGIENMYERAQCIRKILLGVPRATLVVMRYLFAFLNQ